MCVAHEMMSTDPNNRVPGVSPKSQGRANSVEVEGHRTAGSSEREASPVAEFERCRDPETAEVKMSKLGNVTWIRVTSKVRQFEHVSGPLQGGAPGPASMTLTKFRYSNTSPDPRKGFRGPVLKTLTKCGISN